MLKITCLLWGDDPSQGFEVVVSPKDTVFNLKQKISEVLDLKTSLSRKLKIYQIKENVLLDDQRLRQVDQLPQNLFQSFSLDKPFHIIDEYLSNHTDELKELPLDLIVYLDQKDLNMDTLSYNDNCSNSSIPTTTSMSSQSKKTSMIENNSSEKNEIITAHKPVNVIRESKLVQNNFHFDLEFQKENGNIDPSVFPSPPSPFNTHSGESSPQPKILQPSTSSAMNTTSTSTTSAIHTQKQNVNSSSQPQTSSNPSQPPLPTSLTDFCNMEIFPRTKSIIFDVERFPSPPTSPYNPTSTENDTITNASWPETQQHSGHKKEEEHLYYQNSTNPANGSGTVEWSEKDRKTYDIHHFPNVPNEETSLNSMTPLTYAEAPPSYDVITKNEPKTNTTITILPQTNQDQNNTSSSPNTPMIQKDKKSRKAFIRKSILM